MTRSLAHDRSAAMPEESRWLLFGSLAAVAAVFLVRLPAIVQPMGPDQGVYATIAWGMQRGLALYRDLWEQKPPGLYLTYLVGFVLFGSRTSSIFLIDYLAGALTTLLLFDLGRRLAGRRVGALAAAVFALGTLPAARQWLGGFVERAVTETFISLLAAAAAWAATVAITRVRDGWFFATGLFVGLAVVYKQTAFIYLPALVAWTWWVTDAARARRFAMYSAGGALIAPLATVAWLAAEGVLLDAWIAVVEYVMAYLGLGNEGVFSNLDRFAREVWRRMKTDEVWALGTLSAVIALGALRRRPAQAPSDRVATLGIVWLGAALVAIFANTPRLFSTYFVPSLVPLCLLIAWLLDRVLALPRGRRAVASVVLAVLTGTMLVRSGSVSRAVDNTTRDARHLFGATDREDYLRTFQSRGGKAFSAADNARLAEYLRAHTEPPDRIFVFGMTGGAYFLSDRLPASRFLFVYPAVSNMIDRPGFRVEALAAELARAAPRYIVLQRYSGDSFLGWRVEESFAAPPMAELLRDYELETEIGVFLLYRRQDGPPHQADRGKPHHNAHDS